MQTNAGTPSRYGRAALAAAAALLLSWLPGCATTDGDWLQQGIGVLNVLNQGGGQPGVSNADISAAFKEALRIGTGNVVGQLGRVDGFNTDPNIRIPLPEKMRDMKTALARVGAGGLLDDLEIKLNRAAEVATPKAKNLFLQAITQMSFQDIQTIYKGPQDSATRYFRGKMSPSLAREMRPIIEGSLLEVGALRSYDKAIGRYKALPFVPDVKADLADYVVEKGMDGIFHYIAEEEAAIRRDPARRTTELLRRVFGS